jgi:8-oxo-dGTP pyrophosphatase MutT (NUDIX family)
VLPLLQHASRQQAVTVFVDELIRMLPSTLGSPDAVDGASPRGSGRDAAVAAILRAPQPDELELLLIRRADRAGDVWSGHVALPGGRRESDDADVVATATRETMEEVGVDLAAPGARLLGALPPLLPRSPLLPPLTVHPFVWFVTHADPRTSVEVASTHWVTIAHLRSLEHRSEHRLAMPDGSVRSLPSIIIEHELPLWGMTHSIVGTLLDALDQASTASGSSSDC